MFLHLSVSHSVHREEGVPGQVPPWAGTPPWQVHPSWAGTLQAGTPPWQVHPSWAGTLQAGTTPCQVHPQQVHLPGTPPGSYTFLGRYSPSRYTPWTGTPPGQVPPTPGRYTPGNACWDMVNKRAVRILLECILVIFEFSSATT